MYVCLEERVCTRGLIGLEDFAVGGGDIRTVSVAVDRGAFEYVKPVGNRREDVVVLDVDAKLSRRWLSLKASWPLEGVVLAGQTRIRDGAASTTPANDLLQR